MPMRIALLIALTCIVAAPVTAADRPFVVASDKDEYVTVKALGAHGLEDGATFTLDFEVTIESGWHLYSLHLDEKLGVPTKVTVGESAFKATGPPTESKPKSHFSELMGGMMLEHYGTAKFSVPMQVPAGAPAGAQLVPVQFTYQICDANMCLPPVTLDLQVPVNRASAEVRFEETQSDAEEYVVVTARGVNGVKAGTEFELEFDAKIESGWHMYSLLLEEKLGVPTSVTVGQSPFEVIGEPSESEPKSHYSELMEGTMLEHYGAASFKIPLRAPDGLADGVHSIPVTFTYQICDANMCLPPVSLDYKVNVKVGDPIVASGPARHRQTIASPDEEQDLKVTALWPAVVERGQTFKVRFEAEITDGWHIYSIYDPAEKQRTTVTAPSIKPLKLGGDLVELSEPSEHGESLHLEGKPVFELPIDVPADAELGETTVRFLFGYLLCDANGCKPDVFLPDTFEVKVHVVEAGKSDSVSVVPTDFTKKKKVDTDAAFMIEAKVPSGGTFKPGDEFVLELDGKVLKPDIMIPAIEGSFVNQTADRGFLAIILFGIVGALLALLTPCVYPMIPITVSMFTKHAEDEKTNVYILAVVFALGIIVTFTGIGFVASLVLGETAGMWFATNPWINLILGAVFVVFAFSLFGYYDISLPSWFTTKVSGAGSGGGFLGVILMGFIFSVTTFTCVGPIVATLLALSVTGGGQWLALVGMVSFSATFAIPFFCLALFPKILTGMPRSGGWLNSVKIVLGFVELAAAFKFFSIVPFGFFGANLLFRELILFIWAIIFALTAAYLFGLFKFKHDSPIGKRSLARYGFVAIFVGITVYCLYGSTGRLIAGGLEAQITESFFVDHNAHKEYAEGEEKPWRTRTIEAIRESNLWGTVFEPDARALPWQVHSFETKTNLDETFAKLRNGDKRIFVNFTGHT